MIDKELLAILACPQCKGDLEYDQKEQKLIKPEKQELVKSEEQKQPEMITHKVKEGETLWSIAKKYLGSGTRWKELLKPEGTPFTSAEAKKLQVGQEIKIPKLKVFPKYSFYICLIMVV